MTTEHSLNKEQKLQWKQELKTACIAILQQRIINAQQAMQQAQESANSEDKSSAGDKHETARAMSQLDRDMHAKQLEETKSELQVINALNSETLHDKIGIGSVAICSDYLFFISLGLGTTVINGYKVVFLSPKAPLAIQLNQKKVKDQFIFSGKLTEIIEVF